MKVEIREMQLTEDPELWTCPYCKVKFYRTKHIYIVKGKVENIAYNHKLAPKQFGIPSKVSRFHDLHKCRLKMVAISNGYREMAGLKVCWTCDRSDIDYGGYGDAPEMSCTKFSEEGRLEGWKYSRWVTGLFKVTPIGGCEHWAEIETKRERFGD
jgi:hypothetical protein